MIPGGCSQRESIAFIAFRPASGGAYRAHPPLYTLQSQYLRFKVDSLRKDGLDTLFFKNLSQCKQRDNQILPPPPTNWEPILRRLRRRRRCTYGQARGYVSRKCRGEPMERKTISPTDINEFPSMQNDLLRNHQPLLCRHLL